MAIILSRRRIRLSNISYVANRIVYVEDEVKRTSHYLTDDGYNLLLGTLEMEKQHEADHP